MSKIITLSTTDQIAVCKDSETLLVALKQCASDILRNIARMAAILRRLDELGVKVEIDHALLPYIRMIAKGSLSVECFMACSGDPDLLTLATKLPSELQKKLATNEPFEIVSLDGAKRQVGALDMSRNELSQVFVAGRERTEYEKKEFARRSEKSQVNEVHRLRRVGPNMQAALPSKPGGRCKRCGARLMEGVECLTCNLKDEERKTKLVQGQKDYEYWKGTGDESIEDNPSEELSEGWEKRLAEVRAIKDSGNEVGFHVDWLLNYLDTKSGSDDFDSEKLMVLLEKLSASFGYDLSEAA